MVYLVFKSVFPFDWVKHLHTANIAPCAAAYYLISSPICIIFSFNNQKAHWCTVTLTYWATFTSMICDFIFFWGKKTVKDLIQNTFIFNVDIFFCSVCPNHAVHQR